jgi:hypothetical protein
MAILEERGLFWSADEPVPEKQFAPDSCLAGLLTIDDDGQTRLDLDGYLPTPLDGAVRNLMQAANPAARVASGRALRGHFHRRVRPQPG